MAGVFRFSNAVSDIRKFIQTYKLLFSQFRNTHDFTHDDATKALIENGLVSSSGAIGTEAIKRSRRQDRSRDPLYNQLKMYSEIYRMLGWYLPGSKRTQFFIPEYGEYIYEAKGALLKKHFELNVLHIVSPNPHVHIKGNNTLRPFPLVLKLFNELEGILHRDEIILTVLACENDRDPNYTDKAVNYINSIRGNAKKLETEYEALMKKNGIKSKAVLRNYTRFLLGSLKWLDYAHPKRLKNIYGEKPVNMYVQTDLAKQRGLELTNCPDIRLEDLVEYDLDTKSAFSIYSLYLHLERIGYEVSDPETQEEMQKLEEMCRPILERFNIRRESPFLFFSYQECSKDIIANCQNLLDD
ncbi:MAG: hypothetical protein ABGW97_09700 [Christiangramia sp.]|uniref:hypothetical protein n=1 Tax=Christiangramia sp. TaxID=1931228 RepID=UPI003242B971